MNGCGPTPELEQAMISDATDKPIHYQPATTLLEMLGSGQISSVELTDHFIARIEALDPVINAVVVRTFDAAARLPKLPILRVRKVVRSGRCTVCP
ncbi:hypothetical protein [Altericroceibacterium endophyticum]|uniref:Amidase domain-containing protein n=1 Tax=Altericroceibacterium endophyticum TaxID=1808508 RepID=A0A6I4TAI9_9SPHN|nr:hypothetical protein [Altericroceibacterium endophyticum]MXO67191.1 hypothetical protein [Altericroceibacterium endophyticum]